MGIVTGIKAIAAATAPRESVEYEKATWLSVKDGETVTLRFINELDADSPSYDVDRGLAILVEEHQPPTQDGYKRHSLCTLEDLGKCWACEQMAVDKKWRSKQKFYVNVLVDDGKQTPYAAVWSMGTYRNQNFETLKDHFLETNSISNLNWKLKRSGTKTDTTWLFVPKAIDTKPFVWPSDVKPFDLVKIVRTVPYAEQARFYGYEGAVDVPAEELQGNAEVAW